MLSAWTPSASGRPPPNWRTLFRALHDAQGWGITVIETGDKSVIVTNVVLLFVQLRERELLLRELAVQLDERLVALRAELGPLRHTPTR